MTLKVTDQAAVFDELEVRMLYAKYAYEMLLLLNPLYIVTYVLASSVFRLASVIASVALHLFSSTFSTFLLSPCDCIDGRCLIVLFVALI